MHRSSSVRSAQWQCCKQRRRKRALLDQLEPRLLFSAGLSSTAQTGFLVHPTVPARAALSLTKVPSHAALTQPQFHPGVLIYHPVGKLSPNSSAPPGSALTPSQIRSAYGFDQVFFGSVQGTGAGQTIAIIDAYDFPTALNDLNFFSTQYNLPLFNQGGNSPTFNIVNQNGGSTLLGTDPNGAGFAQGTWELEEALDIEWAHAIAPMANLMLVECNSASDADLIQGGVNWARSAPGVVAVSMSFSGGEATTDLGLNVNYTTPAGHPGVTFLAATGDSGATNLGFNTAGGSPAYSPNVVAVGGTSLTLSGGGYGSESGWSGSGGGISTVQSKPGWQAGAVSQSSTLRATPDISMVANPNTGVAIYDSWDYPSSPWLQIGGTSLATPLWAGLIALADQGRASAGLASLDGSTQTLPRLYQLPAADFHDITTGNNGYAAGTGYDLVTGRGTPVANLLVPDLAGIYTLSGTVYQDNNSSGTPNLSDPVLPGTTVFLDANHNGLRDPGSPATTFTATNTPKSIPDNNPAGVTSTLSVSGLGGLITNLTITFSITHPRDSDLSAYLVGPDGTTITLFNNVGNGANFSNTTLSDAASVSIDSGSSPFNAGPYTPGLQPLSTFSGKLATGTWQLKVADTASRRTGSITAWSLTITTGPETATTTDSNGNYSFSGLSPGTYTVGQVVPANYLADTPAAAAQNAVVASAALANLNFGDFPILFTGTNETVKASGGNTQIWENTPTTNPPTYQIPTALLTQSLTFTPAATGSLTLDFSGGNPIPAGTPGLTYNGAAGTLALIGSAPADPVTINPASITRGSATINYSAASLSLDNGTYSVPADLAGPAVSVGSTGIVSFSTTQHLTALTLAAGALASLTAGAGPSGGKVLVLNALNIAGATSAWTAQLDLTNNNLILSAGGPAARDALANQILQGLGLGTPLDPNHNGITSSTALANPAGETTLGYALAGDISATTFEGQSVSTTDVLVKYTYKGDANLEGQVNVADLGILATNYGPTSGATWATGDFNGDGQVNVSDLGLLATNYGLGVASPL